MAHQDPRLSAFCFQGGLEIFHSITHRHQIWKEDPYDVDSIQQEARDLFERYVNRACSQPSPDSGRILLIKGRSGSGKTHLMRTFRSWVHERSTGYFTYMQMTSGVHCYAHYVLSNTLDSLDKPHYEAHGPSSSLMRLADALVEEDQQVVPPSMLTILRDKRLAAKDLSRLVYKLADRIIQVEKFSNIDLDVIRVLLYLQTGDPSLKIRVLKYLRCERLADYDCQILGIAPLLGEDQPMRHLSTLGKLMWAVDMSALVICLDQLEDLLDLHNEQAARQFRQTMQTIIALADQIPTSLVVISCLSDFYVEFGSKLSGSHRARIEQDPTPIVLNDVLDSNQVQQLVSKRLQALYDHQNVSFDHDDPLYPLPKSLVSTLAGMKIRQVLDRCRQIQEQCMQTGQQPTLELEADTEHEENETTPAIIHLEQQWNDFHATHNVTTPDSDAAMRILLAWGIQQCFAEIPGYQCTVNKVNHHLEVNVSHHQHMLESLLVQLCNAGHQRGALERQVKSARKLAVDSKRTVVIVRCTNYPKSATSKIAQQIGQLIAGGGRRIVMEDTDWRTTQALQQFQQQYGQDSIFNAWLVSEKPLTQLPSFQDMLNLSALHSLPSDNAPEKLPPITIPDSPTTHTIPKTTHLKLGHSDDLTPKPIILLQDDLRTHAAFLGGSGSGKTTLALLIIEQLLAQGIPVILVDRKGDLCRIADPTVWTRQDTPEKMATRKALYQTLNIALYTPGSEAGRPLSIALVPPGIHKLPTAEKRQIANYSAMALGEMMNYKPDTRGSDKSRLAILGQAINVLGDVNPKPSLQQLIDFIDSRDDFLINAIGKLDIKLFKNLVSDLQTLKLINNHLFSQQHENLNAEALLGLGAHNISGKTQLSIISTSALGNHSNILFWVAQLLIEIGRFGNRNPSSKLQAVVLFDEADLYLPAQSKPATKEPMENLLKRARSAGIGILLATQSPGDLDYKSRDQIHTWFIGRVKESTALKKLKPMLSEAKIDITSKLAAQTVGQFYMLQNGDVSRLNAEQSLVPTEQVPEEKILQLAKQNR